MLSECKLVDLKKYLDKRGYFQETFNKTIEKEIGQKFVQDNESFSKKYTIRGMHYQWDKPMGKLVRCSYGSIVDVVVDIRKKSKDYGRVYYFNLSSENSKMLWVPPGFAHGFEALSDVALVSYKCTEYYNKDGESGISPLDKFLNIKWISENPIISNKDLSAKSFDDYNEKVRF